MIFLNPAYKLFCTCVLSRDKITIKKKNLSFIQSWDYKIFSYTVYIKMWTTSHPNWYQYQITLTPLIYIILIKGFFLHQTLQWGSLCRMDNGWQKRMTFHKILSPGFLFSHPQDIIITAIVWRIYSLRDLCLGHQIQRWDCWWGHPHKWWC